MMIVPSIMATWLSSGILRATSAEKGSKPSPPSSQEVPPLRAELGEIPFAM